jgi:hypothetical protein
MSELASNTCCDCGITFSFSKQIENIWRNSHKQFYCPNGHSLVFPGETVQEKELKELRQEVTKLKEQLQIALDDGAKLSKMANELMSELEIWKPQSVEKEAV